MQQYDGLIGGRPRVYPTRPVPAGMGRVGYGTTSTVTGISGFTHKEHDFSRFWSYVECVYFFRYKNYLRWDSLSVTCDNPILLVALIACNRLVRSTYLLVTKRVIWLILASSVYEKHSSPQITRRIEKVPPSGYYVQFKPIHVLNCEKWTEGSATRPEHRPKPWKKTCVIVKFSFLPLRKIREGPQN